MVALVAEAATEDLLESTGHPVVVTDLEGGTSMTGNESRESGSPLGTMFPGPVVPTTRHSAETPA